MPRDFSVGEGAVHTPEQADIILFYEKATIRLTVLAGCIIRPELDVKRAVRETSDGDEGGYPWEKGPSRWQRVSQL